MKTTKKEISENTLVTRVSFSQYRYNYSNRELEDRFDGTNIEGRVYNGVGICVGGFSNGKKGFVDAIYKHINS